MQSEGEEGGSEGDKDNGEFISIDEKIDESLHEALGSLPYFCLAHHRVLRSYQVEVAKAVWDMLRGKGGRSMAVMFPRQSGKNELQAYLEAYLLLVCHNSSDAEIIKVAPTWSPQSLEAMHRLEKILNSCLLARPLTWRKEHKHSIRVGGARITFFSGQPGANIVGATASLLLSVDEAQDISPSHYDAHIAPMAAAKNSPRIFWGTAWTAETLLAREWRIAARLQEEERGEGQRAFRADARRVGAEVPAYAAFVSERISLLGRDHPAVRTQYFSEEIDAAGGLFSGDVLARIRGEHAWMDAPRPGCSYAFLLDVGGEQSGGTTDNPAERHDATALVIVEVEVGQSSPWNTQAVYRVVHLRSWSGTGQPTLSEELLALERRWKPRKVVVDATGLGQGLAAALEQALPGRLRRFTFTAKSKSSLGWSFRSLVAGERFWLPRDGGELVERLREQMARCTQNVGSGPDQSLRWSVPEDARWSDGSLLHDDLLMAAALCTQLDQESWPLRSDGVIFQTRDPLREIDAG